MTPLERAIQQQRAALLRIEQNGASAIVASYKAVERRLKYNLALLAEQIEQARAAGFETKPGWLFAQSRYHALMGDLQQETLNFLHTAIAEVTKGQREAVERAPADADSLMLAALGRAPRSAVAQARADFGRLPAPQLRHLVGYAGDNQPLGLLLGEIAPASAQAVKNSLAYGVATGQNPRVIARDVETQSGISRNRALAISRTEVLRAHRTVSQERFTDSKAVKDWTWVASLDARCCPACLAMNGTQHPLGEQLHSHPCCRCTPVPNTVSWEELGFTGIADTRPQFQPPETQFAALPEAQRLAILGKARLDAYDAGEITLADMVHQTHSDRWGDGRRASTLTELGVST